jgi:hypothetical protein
MLGTQCVTGGNLEYSVVKDLRDPFLVWAHYGWDETSYYVLRATYKTSRTSYVVRSTRLFTPAAVPSGPLYPSD